MRLGERLREWNIRAQVAVREGTTLPDLEIGEFRADVLGVLTPVGGKSLSMVYLIEMNGRKYAMKLWSNTRDGARHMVSDFLNECERQKLSRDDFPANLQLPFEVNEQGMLVEYFEGQSWQDFLLGEASLEEKIEVSKNVMEGILELLSEMESIGLIHRDIKLGNILLHPDGRVVLIDPDHISFLKDAEKNYSQTGTAYYRPKPNHPRGSENTHARDLYSLAKGIICSLNTESFGFNSNSIQNLDSSERKKRFNLIYLAGIILQTYDDSPEVTLSATAYLHLFQDIFRGN